jgi:AAA domain
MGSPRKGRLLFLCGKMAAGKSTLSRELAAREDAVLLVQDDLLFGLFRLHFIMASDDLCKRQLRQRSTELGMPVGAKWTTDEDFEEVTAYFDAPSAEENFNVVQHERN